MRRGSCVTPSVLGGSSGNVKEPGIDEAINQDALTRLVLNGWVVGCQIGRFTRGQILTPKPVIRTLTSLVSAGRRGLESRTSGLGSWRFGPQSPMMAVCSVCYNNNNNNNDIYDIYKRRKRRKNEGINERLRTEDKSDFDAGDQIYSALVPWFNSLCVSLSLSLSRTSAGGRQPRSALKIIHLSARVAISIVW